MKKYFRIILGRNHVFADESIKGNFVGVGFIREIDFTVVDIFQRLKKLFNKNK